MSVRFLVAIIAVSAFLFITPLVHAITISAAPNPATAGQPVSFSIGTSFMATPTTSCSLTVDFGDGVVQGGIVPSGGTSFLTLLHTYAASGTYLASVRSVACAATMPEPTPPDPAYTTVVVGTLGITRMELAFPGGKGDVTVRRNDEGLKATATMSTAGSGILKGFWEVDGRLLQQVERHVTFGQLVTLETPAIPPLPTFDPGVHILRFVVTTPEIPFELPLLVYTVTPVDGRPIQLVEPLAHTFIPFGPAVFRWNGRSGDGSYLVRFTATDGTSVFSAETKTDEYRLSELALKNYFSPGIGYLWQVQAYDGKGILVGESQQSAFSFQVKPSGN